MDVQTPETPGRLSLRLDVESPPQVLQIDGRLCHLVLAFPIERDVTEQQGPLAPWALPHFVATTDPSATLSPSIDFPVWPVIRSTLLPVISPRGEEGFSSCSACPCHRA